MNYPLTRNEHYDFTGEAYGAKLYPNLHPYPATMIPQLGIDILKELNITQGRMLDPYCGSGSSFIAGLEVGLDDFTGYDINPLALLICQARLTYLDMEKLESLVQKLERRIERLRASSDSLGGIEVEKFNNFDYWFSPHAGQELQWIKNTIVRMTKPSKKSEESYKDSEALRRFLFLPLSVTMRQCSYTRDKEFKLYRMSEDKLENFSPPVFSMFTRALRACFLTYKACYAQKIKGIQLTTNLGAYNNSSHNKNNSGYDVILTSPPYGDSRTTVAYGQFSLFANAWLLEQSQARAIDNLSLGGKRSQNKDWIAALKGSALGEVVASIANEDESRAAEVAAFYRDLKESMARWMKALKVGGKAVVVVGNRMVKGFVLPTDQFVAECMEQQNLCHEVSYQRKISRKRMPSRNSPRNLAGETAPTMMSEFIVVGSKRR